MADQGSDDRATWYQDAVIYELHVRAFADSDGDGIGDFRGLTQRLDYLRDLGVTALWLLPFYPSPLRDDGYDIADYTAVHPAYGTMRDFKAFLKAAHARGLRVITELVLNHTSDQHPWFQRARRAQPGSPWRDFYVWSDDPDRYAGARVIFRDYETSNWAWDPDARAYYWHRFYAHQPDLNFASLRVRAAMLRVVDFWLDLGVDGLRLDAVPYLFEREGTTSENLPRTHAFLRRLRRHVDGRYAGRMLLAEANQWPEDAAAYLGDGDECHMAFHFPLMPRLFMALRQADRFPIADILAQTPALPESAQWALFLRNHDELTLEMVTEEERAFLYRVYAEQGASRINLGIRRRLAPLVHNDRRRIELLHGLLCSLPGTPVLYYGDEIGMGDNIYLGDRDGVRTPMQWGAGRNGGFSAANPQQLYLPLVVDPEYHHEAVHVEAQQQNPSSLLNWTRRLLALRQRSPAFGRGDLALLQPVNHRVLAFLRSYRDEQVLVVANLSRFAQHAELDLAALAGSVPVELFGRTRLPAVGEQPYPVLLAPYAFLWLALEPPGRAPAAPAARPVLAVRDDWGELFAAPLRAELEELLPGFLAAQPWFGGKARTPLGARIVELVPVSDGGAVCYLAQLAVGYADGEPETYLVPFGVATGDRAREVEARSPVAIVAGIRSGAADDGEEGVLYDAAAEPYVARGLLDLIARNRKVAGAAGSIRGRATPGLRQAAARGVAALPVVPVASEQTNTSLRLGERWVLKLFRRLDAGANPERTIGEYLTRRGVAFAPALDGYLQYVPARGEARDLGILQRFVPHDGTAWQALHAAARRGGARAAATAPAAIPVVDARALLDLAARAPAPEVAALLGDALAVAAALGARTAELHCLLAAARDDPQFAPEPITPFYQRARYQALRSLTGRTFAALRVARGGFPAPLRERAERALACEGKILRRFEGMRARPLGGLRTRHHGNYHLGQLLATADGWAIIDFEGEPARPLYEREIKQPPLVDVASLLGSLYTVGLLAGGEQPDGARWERAWLAGTGAAFLRAYLGQAEPGGFLPREREECVRLLDVLLLERAVYELGYALDTRPDRVGVPLRGLLHLLDEPETGR